VSTISNAEYLFRGGLYVDGIVSILLYVLRYAAMYVGLSKFVVNWGGTALVILLTMRVCDAVISNCTQANLDKY